MVPSYAGAAITEKEIQMFETQLIREQFCFKGDVKSEEILKIVGFTPKSTACIISKMGNILRRIINVQWLAKPVKNFMIKAKTIEEEL